MHPVINSTTISQVTYECEGNEAKLLDCKNLLTSPTHCYYALVNCFSHDMSSDRDKHGSGGNSNSSDCDKHGSGGNSNSSDCDKHGSGGNSDSSDCDKHGSGGNSDSSDHNKHGSGGNSDSSDHDSHGSNSDSQLPITVVVGPPLLAVLLVVTIVIIILIVWLKRRAKNLKPRDRKKSTPAVRADTEVTQNVPTVHENPYSYEHITTVLPHTATMLQENPSYRHIGVVSAANNASNVMPNPSYQHSHVDIVNDYDRVSINLSQQQPYSITTVLPHTATILQENPSYQHIGVVSAANDASNAMPNPHVDIVNDYGRLAIKPSQQQTV